MAMSTSTSGEITSAVHISFAYFSTNIVMGYVKV